MAKRNKIIAFVGPNGVGKSTQMALLIPALRKRGVRVRKTWVASHHLFVWVLGIILVKLGYPKDHWTTVNPDLIPAVNFGSLLEGKGIRVKIGKVILLSLEILNLVIIDLVKVRIPRMFGYCIIIEKYLPVTIADLSDIFGSNFINGFWAKFVIKLIPKDLCCIYLYADYENLQKRRGDKTESKEYLDLQCKISKWYAEHNPCLVIDTTKKNIEESHEMIMSYLNLV